MNKHAEFLRGESGAGGSNWNHRILAAAEEIERLDADAARYRWLRSQHWENNTISAVRYPKDAMKLGHDAPSGERLDALIDEAIAILTNHHELNTITDRDRFEAWAHPDNIQAKRDHVTGEYTEPGMRAAWSAWQANTRANFARHVECVNHHADIRRIVAWLEDPHRKPANTAFTEGPERQIAYLFEMFLRGEFICNRCLLRKDSENHGPADF